MNARTEQNCIIEIDHISPADWHRQLETFNDANIYQTWCYGAARWGETVLSHLVLKHENEILGSAQLRIVRTPVIGSGIAYLRWGPLFQSRNNSDGGDSLRRLIMALQMEYSNKRGHALRILPNAFVGTARAKMFQSVLIDSGFTPAKEGPEYRTMLVDMSPSLEEIRRKFDQKWRNQLNQSERNGLVVTEGTDAESWRLLEQIYAGMMIRKRFETSINIHEFGSMQSDLPANLKMRVFIARHEGQPVAGIACSFIGETAIYLIGATSEKALKLRAANLLQWEAIKRAKQLGIGAYDLGGIDPEANPGGFHFKRGLSGQDVSHLPAFDFYSSANQRLVLTTTFKAARVIQAWRARRNKVEATN